MWDAVYTSGTLADKPARAFLREAMSRDRSTFHRVGSFTRFLAARLPGVIHVHGAWEAFEELPVRGPWGKVIAVGSVASCVAIDSAPPRHVIKFWRRSLGDGIADLVLLAGELQEEYETVKRWYVDIPNLIPRTVHVILKAPMHGVPAVAAVQELVVEPATDLLRDHSDDGLIALLLRHDRLRTHFISFVASTRRAWDEEGRFLDMVGRDNVMLIDKEGEPQLRVADFGIWNLARQRRDGPARYARAEKVLLRLERITGQAS